MWEGGVKVRERQRETEAERHKDKESESCTERDKETDFYHISLINRPAELNPSSKDTIWDRVKWSFEGFKFSSIKVARLVSVISIYFNRYF